MLKSTVIHKVESPKRATWEDIESVESLWTPELGIFNGVPKTVLEHILAHSTVVTYPPDEPVFHQGKVQNDVFLVLAGRFEVVHVWGDDELTVAFDSPGSLFADVELLIKDMPEHAIKSLRRPNLTPLTTWSTIKSQEPGKVLQISPALELLGPQLEIIGPEGEVMLERSYRMAWNLGRILALKLLKRSAASDPYSIYKKKPRSLLLAYLQGLIEVYRLVKDPKKEEHFRIATSVKQTQIRDILKIGKSSISEFFASWDGHCVYVGSTHEIVNPNDPGYIRMSRDFIEQELGIIDPESLLLSS